MAIYDNRGVLRSEIGSLYDNNGTTTYQTYRVYDNNGLVNSLLHESATMVMRADDSDEKNWVASVYGAAAPGAQDAAWQTATYTLAPTRQSLSGWSGEVFAQATVQTDALTLEGIHNGAGGGVCALRTQRAYDLTGASAVRLRYFSGGFRAGALPQLFASTAESITAQTAALPPEAAAAAALPASAGLNTVTLDVTALRGDHYLWLWFCVDASAADADDPAERFTVTQITLE